jgi:hypothetical protein
VPPGLFHDFHQSWSIRIKDALNAGRLPKGIEALVEQRVGLRESDILSVERRRWEGTDAGRESGIVTLERPATRIVQRSDRHLYAARANRIVVRHHLGRIIAVIELVSPGNKDSRAALRDFVEKTIEFLRARIHVLIIDLFPPTPRDPFGIHKAIWDEIEVKLFSFPAGKDRILVAYEASGVWTAYVEPVGVGDALPDMPLFLAEGMHVKVPLEATYQSTWDASPDGIRVAVETGVLPEADVE